MTLVEKHQRKNEGFFVSIQGNLAVMKLLFLEQTTDTVNCGISFLQEFYGDGQLRGLGTGMLLHYSRFTYGVAGTDVQSFSFLLSKEMQEIERYTDWFRSLGLKLVITEAVRKRESLECILRYIGYIRLPEKDEKLNMYEVLDACPPQELRAKGETNDRFQEAIQLFYQDDFYLARSAFSDVLKESPADLIAKWYLFTCERYLNEAQPSGDPYRLIPEEGPKKR